MVGTIIIIILFVLCVLLLLPVRAKASFGDGKWAVSVYYAFIRVFHKESKEKTEPELPKKPEDLPEGEAPPEPKPEPAPKKKPQSKPKKDQKAESKPKPQQEAVPKPAAVTEMPEPEEEPAEPVDPEQLADTVDTPDIKPAKRKKQKKTKAKPAEDPVGETEQPEKKPRGIRGFIERVKPHSLSDVLGLVQDGFAALTPALKFLTKHIHFRHIKLYLAIGTDDPANTATLYGKICAAAYNLLGAMQCWFDVEADEFRILADFYNEKVTFRGALELRISPMAALVLVLILGVKFLWRTICRFRREDREAKRRAEESAPLPETEQA